MSGTGPLTNQPLVTPPPIGGPGSRPAADPGLTPTTVNHALPGQTPPAAHSGTSGGVGGPGIGPGPG